MRVALIAPLIESVPPRFYGGTERVVYNLCRGLQAKGIEVTLFASGDSSAGPQVELVAPIDEALRLRKTPVRDPIAYNFKLMSEVAGRADEFDVIHNHHDYWMLPLTRMTDTPVVTTLHGRLDLQDIPVGFEGFPEATFISISDSQRTPLPSVQWMGTIHHGIDLTPLKFNPNPGKYLAFLGRMDEEKRPDWAIRIAKLSGIPLKIAAKIEGPEMQQFYETAVKPHVDGDFIEYVGEITEHEKSDFLGNALAVTFPIDWPEPFGLVMLESLACGTPVLARPCGSVNELLRNGVTGFVHPDVEHLARSVANIGAIDRYGCRKWVEERFSLERMTEDYIDVYRRLAESAERRHPARADRRRRHLLHSLQRTADGNS